MLGVRIWAVPYSTFPVLKGKGGARLECWWGVGRTAPPRYRGSHVSGIILVEMHLLLIAFANPLSKILLSVSV